MVLQCLSHIAIPSVQPLPLHTEPCRPLESTRCSCNCSPHDFDDMAASHVVWSEIYDPQRVVLARCFHCFVSFLCFLCWQSVPTVALVCRPKRLQMRRRHIARLSEFHRCWLLLSRPRRFQDHDVFTAERHVAGLYCQSSPCRQHVCELMDLHVKSKTRRSDCHNSGAILAWCNPVLIASLGPARLPTLLVVGFNVEDLRACPPALRWLLSRPSRCSLPAQEVPAARRLGGSESQRWEELRCMGACVSLRRGFSTRCSGCQS